VRSGWLDLNVIAGIGVVGGANSVYGVDVLSEPEVAYVTSGVNGAVPRDGARSKGWTGEVT
jgi:hypothetical protein